MTTMQFFMMRNPRRSLTDLHARSPVFGACLLALKKAELSGAARPLYLNVSMTVTQIRYALEVISDTFDGSPRT